MAYGKKTKNLVKVLLVLSLALLVFVCFLEVKSQKEEVKQAKSRYESFQKEFIREKKSLNEFKTLKNGEVQTQIEFIENKRKKQQVINPILIFFEQKAQENKIVITHLEIKSGIFVAEGKAQSVNQIISFSNSFDQAPQLFAKATIAKIDKRKNETVFKLNVVLR